MGKRTIKLLGKLGIGFIFLCLVLVVAMLWPMPELKPPQKHKSIYIKSINLIDVTTGKILANQDVFIENNRIKAIKASNDMAPKANTFVIDGANRYLIPGLWDMHTHSTQHSEWLHHPLYIANGVTGIRDMSGQLNKRDSYWVGSKERLAWNADLMENLRVMPRYVLQSSYQMDGFSSVPSGFPDFFKLQSPRDVDSLLVFYKKEKVDFIKIYQQIIPESYKQLAQKAPEYGLHIAGHKPIFTSLEDAIVLGQRSFEHGRIFMFEAFPNADSLRLAKNWKQYYSKSKRSMVLDFDTEKAHELMILMQKYDAHWVPTLQTLKFEAHAHKPAYTDNPNLKYVTPIRKKIWWGIDTKKNSKRNTTLESKGLSLAFYEACKKQIAMANAAGVPIMTGTDVTDSYIFPGFSLHNELEDLKNCGLSNLEVLQSATIVPATFAGKKKKYGSIAVGKIADLVILNKNPLADITNTRTINAVIMNGIYYNSDTIDHLKDYTQSMASSFHLNVKVFFSLVGSPLMRVQFMD